MAHHRRAGANSLLIRRIGVLLAAGKRANSEVASGDLPILPAKRGRGPPEGRWKGAARSKVLRALFWADVEEQRAHGRDDNNPAYFWQIINPHSLWHLEESDLYWLEQDLADGPMEADQRIALSAIVTILRSAERLDAELPRWRP